MLSHVGVIVPALLLRACRLRLFARLLTKRYTPILAVLYHSRAAPKSWLSAIEHDLDWLASSCSKLSAMQGAPLPMWVTFILDHPRVFAQLLSATITNPPGAVPPSRSHGDGRPCPAPNPPPCPRHVCMRGL